MYTLISRSHTTLFFYSNGVIDSEEFYRWLVVNAKSEGMSDEQGTKKIEIRTERLEVGKDGIGGHLMELLEEVRRFDLDTRALLVLASSNVCVLLPDIRSFKSEPSSRR